VKGGHNRKPTRQKALEGTLRADRSRKNEPRAASVTVPAAPRRLPAGERAVWSQLAAEVEALGVFTLSDRTAFELLARTVALAKTAGPEMAPTARVRLLQVASGLLAAFGLTPASRGRVEAAPPVDPVAADLFGDLKVVAGGRAGA